MAEALNEKLERIEPAGLARELASLASLLCQLQISIFTCFQSFQELWRSFESAKSTKFYVFRCFKSFEELWRSCESANSSKFTEKLKMVESEEMGQIGQTLKMAKMDPRGPPGPKRPPASRAQ